MVHLINMTASFLRQRFPNTAGFDPRLVTKLVYCYRSLPSIMHLFSSMFYQNELRPVICPDTSDESAMLRELDGILPGAGGQRQANHAAFFVGVRGQNLQDTDSPSWYNAAEAKQVDEIQIIRENRNPLISTPPSRSSSSC